MNSYMDYILTQLKNLTAIDSPSGYTKEVTDYLISEYKSLGYAPKKTVKGGVLVDLGGADKENALFMEAHVDTLGAMVAEIKENGRLRLTPLGGLNANNAEAENCRIHTRFHGTYEGTMQLTDASIHVNGKYNDTSRSFDVMEVLIDEKVSSKKDVEALGIMAGDVVCFDPRTTITRSGYLKSRFLMIIKRCHSHGICKIFKRGKCLPKKSPVSAFYCLRRSGTWWFCFYSGRRYRSIIRRHGLCRPGTFL